MSASVVEFYSGVSGDHRGRTLEELLGWSDDRLEAVHDFIQWLFPLPEASPVNPSAPLLTREAIEAFHARPELCARLRSSLEGMLKFCGLELRDTALGSPLEVIAGGNFKVRAANWLGPGNHNHLRITRILKCCALAGLDAEARAFLQRLEAIYSEHRAGITAESLRYWREAVRVMPD